MDINAELKKATAELNQAEGQARIWSNNASYLRGRIDVLKAQGAELPPDDPEPGVGEETE